MKKTMRILAMILVLSLFAAMAIGSSSGKTDDVKEPASVSSGGNPSAQSNGSTSAAETTAPQKDAVTIDQVVLLDEAGLKITAKGLETQGFFGPSLKLLVENNTDKNLTVQARKSSINGYMVETMLSSDVAAGKKANDELTFLRSELDQAGISTIADIAFCFHIFETETWETYLDSDPVSLKTSAAEGFVYEYDNSGFPAYNSNGVEIVVKGLSNDSILGPGVVVYISNTGNKDVCVQARNLSVNGFMIDPIFSSEVVAGKHAVDAITFLSSDLEKNEITSIEEVELSFHIFDADTWMDGIDTDTVTITFSSK